MSLSKTGYLEIIYGCMFAGKSSTLYDRLNPYIIAKKRILCIVHSNDTKRLNGKAYYSHNKLYDTNIPPPGVSMIYTPNLLSLDEIKEYDVIAIDEAQFFHDLSLVKEYVEVLKKKVYIAGLLANYKRQFFGQLYTLFPFADKITLKEDAVCKNCAEKHNDVPIALFSHKMIDNNIIEEVGASETYTALCRSCYVELNVDVNKIS